MKSAPHDAESINATFLTQAGFVRQEMAGVYSWLPFGLRVLNKVIGIIREEMNSLGAQEILMPSLQSKEAWTTTGRWDNVDILFKLVSQTKKEYALGPSHEEVVTPLVQQFVKSYRDLPVSVYQFQTKFRDELRAKSGVLRGREFGMKDMYSFHATEEDLEAFYARTKEAYLRVYSRCGLNAKVTEASGGIFTKNVSHEFQVITPAGEDVLIACPSCVFAQNSEVATLKEGAVCPSCGSALILTKGVEVGNIFNLGTRYTDDFKMNIQLENGERQTVLMGCYGIGTTRLVGTIVEASHDDSGMIWPKSVAPFHVEIVSIRAKDAQMNARVLERAQGLYEELTRAGVEVLWDDRDTSPGEKFADADLIGIPLRLVISERTLATDSVEWKWRTSSEAQSVALEDVTEDALAWVKE